MTQKTIKALYKQPVNYKLTKDGYKTISGVIQAQDGMPKVVDLSAPSELYTTDLQYNVNTEVNGAPIITTESFTLPDNEICEAKEYCYAPKGIDYNYIRKQDVKHDNFTIIGSPTISQNGLLTNITTSNYLQLPEAFNPGENPWEMLFRVKTSSDFSDLKNNITGSNTQSNWQAISCGITDTHLFKLGISVNGSSWDPGYGYGTYYVLPETWYYIKIQFTGSRYQLYYSLDGNNYILDIDMISSLPVYQNNTPYLIGLNKWSTDSNSWYPWTGTIDLSESYIKINDEIWWVPYTYHEEEVTIQIPGILDSSVVTDNWQQSQEYKLYQLKNQNNTDTLQLTENGITDTTQKYKQYIDQLTIPARDYKWYYNGIPQHVSTNFYNYGAEIDQNNVATNFKGFIRTQPLSYMSLGSTELLIFFNIETGDISTDCAFFDIYSPSKLDASTLFAIRDGKFSCNSYSNPTHIVYGSTNLSSNTKYWVGLYLNRMRMVMELYLLSDNNYQKENLPHIFLWKKELTFDISLETISLTPYIGAQYRRTQALNNFTGKLYLNNLFATRTLTTSYGYICWESVSYSGYQYKWYANKSLYDHIENEIYADTLNFSDSWVNVTNDWKTQKQYVNPKVCLMPIDGGETITTYSLNATEIGNTNFNTDTGIVSGFSSNDYLQLPNPFNPGENSWEMIIKIRTGTDLQTWQELFHSSVSPNESGRYGISVLIDSGTFELDISTNDSSWIGTDHGTFVLSENSDYWVKIGWNSNEYYLEYSTNGVNYTRDITYTSSNNLPSLTNSWIGIYRNSNYSYPMLGIIDLSESYIKINDEIWWNGVNSTVKEHQYITAKDTLNITNYDHATVNNGIISNITGLITTNNSITIYKDKPFEIFGRIKTGSNTSGIQEIFTDYGSNLFLLRNSGTYWNVCYYVNGSWRQTNNGGFYSNTSYLIRLRYFPEATTKDGFSYSAKTVYFEYLKENDSVWTRDYSYSLATYFFGNDASVTSRTFNMTIGSQNGLELWTGSIDLKECYVKVDNEFVWKGINVKEIINGCVAGIFTDEGQEHQFDVYYDSNYTQPILVSAGESYSEGTKVDTITIPAHKTWNYQAGGNWEELTFIDVSNSTYTYENGNLTLTYYTGNETDVTLPNIASEE